MFFQRTISNISHFSMFEQVGFIERSPSNEFLTENGFRRISPSPLQNITT